MSSEVVGVLDTAITSENYGDQIIMSAARKVVNEIFNDKHQLAFPTHARLDLHSLRRARSAKLAIACGTNLLHSHMGLVQQWRIGPIAALAMPPVVLLGVGWRSKASRRTDLFTKWLLRRALSSEHLHSVRDSYSEEKLRSAGISNVINTGCPTLWSLSPTHCANIPESKGIDAVLVLTDYSPNERDRHLVQITLANYRNVYFWPQGEGDVRYARSMPGGDKLKILPRNLDGYDTLLSNTSLSLDYVGTRLHGGIRALQHCRRTIIIGVDHRGNAMGRDFNLPVIDRYSDRQKIEERILSPTATTVNLPIPAITKWKDQFA